jgi:steroid delta-isomerase-like uncharacterized protein
MRHPAHPLPSVVARPVPVTAPQAGRRRAALAALVLPAWAGCATPVPAAAEGEGARVVRRFWRAFAAADWPALDALVTADYVHRPPGAARTLQQFKDGGAWVHRGAADYGFEIEDLVEQRDRVAVRWTASGRHTGSFFGEAPSGRVVTVQGMHVHRLRDGRIAEDWEVIDFDGFRRRIGAR